MPIRYWVPLSCSSPCLHLYLFNIPQPPFLVFILNFIPPGHYHAHRGPLLYYYVRAVTKPATLNFNHFWPAVIDAGAQLIAAAYFIGVFCGLVDNKPGPWASAIDTYNVYSDIPRCSL